MVFRRCTGLSQVRIEDDVAVTAGAPEVLSAGVPVDAREVERLVQGKD